MTSTRNRTRLARMVAQCFTHFATAANYVCEGINYPSEKNDQKTFEKYNLTTALNILYAKKEKNYPGYVSKQLKS